MSPKTAAQPLCTCCTPASPLVRSEPDGSTQEWYCTATLQPYALLGDAAVALSTTPGPWDEGSAGPTTVRAVRVDLSQVGYS